MIAAGAVPERDAGGKASAGQPAHRPSSVPSAAVDASARDGPLGRIRRTGAGRRFQGAVSGEPTADLTPAERQDFGRRCRIS
ncbi:hypothetical protein TR75_01785 [Hydrogenibacillus schlegelii]|uniref:Uncharacterized protein n=1 Tax=Hydrogenibacillus schlegelii TaxID=1484 RepID=A0A132ND13_HYDSH|nr:hypothetical protein TR75_01785 [Hydrogenibacillus schlegelii]OAR04618.1 hypothetical protein SA87_08750 [Hydrogenibacillus schlegelii]